MVFGRGSLTCDADKMDTMSTGEHWAQLMLMPVAAVGDGVILRHLFHRLRSSTAMVS